MAIVAVLGFAPSAFADNIALPPISVPISGSPVPSLPVEVATPAVAVPLHVMVPSGASSSSPSLKPTPGAAPVIAAREMHVHVLSSKERGAPAQRETHATPTWQLTTLRASTAAGSAPRTSHALVLPLQTPWGIVGTVNSVSPSVFPFVLFVLAAALVAIAAPRLGRRLQLFIRAPRPYRCLLALERPD